MERYLFDSEVFEIYLVLGSIAFVILSLASQAIHEKRQESRYKAGKPHKCLWHVYHYGTRRKCVLCDRRQDLWELPNFYPNAHPTQWEDSYEGKPYNE